LILYHTELNAVLMRYQINQRNWPYKQCRWINAANAWALTLRNETYQRRMYAYYFV